MILRVLRKFLIPLLLLSYTTLSAFAEPAESTVLRGKELSDFVEDTLQKNQFSPQNKPLCQTGSDIFPRIISVDFQGYYTDEQSDPKTLVYCLSQEDFYNNTASLIEFIKYTENAKLPYPVEFVFTPLDNRNLTLPGYDITLQGTQNYALSNENPENIFVILLNFDAKDKSKARIYTNGLKKSTPLWLTREVTQAFLEKKVKFSAPQKFLSLYRAGLLFGDTQMASFFSQGISCIKIEFTQQSELEVLKSFMSTHDTKITEINDVHYSFFTLFSWKSFWISERVNLISLEVFGILSILFLVCFTFTGKKRIRSKRQFSRYWFVLPLLIAVSLLSLYISQFICIHAPFIYKSNPVVQFASKLFISITLISVLFVFQNHLKLEHSAETFGFLLTLTAVLNIFLFSVADIGLFWTFAIEFFIIYTTRNAKTTIQLILSFVLMTLPFWGYFAVYFLNTNIFDVRVLIKASPGVNLLLSLILFPFQIIWLKVLLRIRTNRIPGFNFKKFALYTAFSAAVILGTLIIFTFLTTEFLYKKSKDSLPAIKYTDKNAENLSVTDESISMPQLTSHTLKIASKKQAERYRILISSSLSNPVLDSMYEYNSQENSKIADFKLPDYPPQEITIEVAVEKNNSKMLTITALYKTKEENVYERETVTKIWDGGEN